jgi:hypothetical protein
MDGLTQQVENTTVVQMPLMPTYQRGIVDLYCHHWIYGLRVYFVTTHHLSYD